MFHRFDGTHCQHNYRCWGRHRAHLVVDQFAALVVELGLAVPPRLWLSG